MEKVRVVQIGLGPLGRSIVQYITGKRCVELAGAADSDPAKAGMDAGELCGAPGAGGMKVYQSAASLLEEVRPDAVILATVSSLASLSDQIAEIAPFGADIVSTCEELSFPWKAQPEIAEKIDGEAKKNGITVLGTGVNPGFLMDYLPIVFTGVCREISSIQVFRIQDATHRRSSFRKKIGAGISPAEFEKLKNSGVLRHVGLTESVHMLAAGAGWELERTEESIEPVIAGSPLSAGGEDYARGAVLGVQQIARGYAGGREVITLWFRAAVGEKEPADTIKIEGTPSITSTVPGGINGDIATCSVAVNAVGAAVAAESGLKTMFEVPPVRIMP